MFFAIIFCPKMYCYRVVKYRMVKTIKLTVFVVCKKNWYLQAVTAISFEMALQLATGQLSSHLVAPKYVNISAEIHCLSVILWQSGFSGNILDTRAWMYLAKKMICLQ